MPEATGRGPDLVAVALGVGVAVYLLLYPPTLNGADEAVVLYGARRIFDGQALYRDFFEFLTPASFYFFALVYAVGGVTLNAAQVAMAVVNALACVILYRLARRVAGPAESLLAALVTALVCLPAWRMASPHWLSDAVCLGAAAALLAERGRPAGRAAAAGALTGLAFANQQQRGVFLAVWLVAAVGLLATLEPPGARLRRARRDLGAAAGAGLAVATAIVGYSIWRSSPAAWFDSTVRFVLTDYRRTWLGAVSWGGYLWPLNAVARRTWVWLPALVWPVLAVEALALARARRRRWAREEAVRFVLLVLAVTMAWSVLYYPDLVHVLFIAPFTLIVAARLVHGMRAAAATRPLARRGVEAVLAGALLATLAKGWTTLAFDRSAAPERYPTAFGTVAGPANARANLEAVRAAVGAAPGVRSTFFVYPSDAGLYLTVPGENPTPFSLMHRGYNGPAHYRAAIDALEQQRVPYVVLLPHLAGGRDAVTRYVELHYLPRLLARGGAVYSVYQRRAEP